MKIVIDRHIPYLYERLVGKCDAVMLDPKDIIAENIKDADALIVRTRTKCNAALLEGSNVKLVGTGTIGFDHIDREWCASKGITTVNAAGCNAPAVAQYVISSLLRAGYDPRKHLLGVVGKGHIGSIVTEIARRSGGEVMVCDPPRAKEGYMDERYRSLNELLSACDAVTFHVPLTHDGEFSTHHLLNEGNISLLKDDAMVVNASRGGVIDEESVLQGGRPGQKWIIDTWEGEPFVNREMLSKAFIATPHIAGYSEEGKQRATRRMIEALNSRFGLDIATDGLAQYDFNPQSLSAWEIAESFDPSEEMEKLIAASDDFETQRDSYIFRAEPKEK